MAAVFCCLLSSFLLFSCMFNTSLGNIRFSCLDVCFIIFGRSCLLSTQICKNSKSVLMKNRSESWLKVYKKMLIFMKSCADR